MSLFESASLVVTPNGTKASKLYSVKPADGSGDMTVTRATTATRVNSSGIIESVATNVPRLDYTGSTCPSILIEPQRTNLLLRSEEFDNASWSKANSTITSNSIISPDGTQDADTLVENTSNSTHLLLQSVSLSAQTYTFSCYIKQILGNNRNVGIVFNSIAKGVLVNPSNGSVVSYLNTSSSDVKISNVGNGWFRVSLTALATATSESLRIYLGNGTTWTSAYLGDGTSGVYIWGAQLEAGSSATSYIPTTTATVTRNLDSISKTGISSLIGQTEGTIFLDLNIKNLGFIRSFISVQDASYATNAFRIESNAFNQFRLQIRSLSTVIVDHTLSQTFTTGKYKLAFSYNTQTNGVAFYVNGSLLFQTTASSIPNLCNSIYIGSRNLGGLDLIVNDSINAVSLWKTRLTNAELATLTTL